MAANKVQYVLGISADTSLAKKAIDDLQKSLTLILTTNAKGLHLDVDLEKASSAAKTLLLHLVAATNVNTGNLNLNLFVTSLNKSGLSLSKLSSDLINAGNVGQSAFMSLSKAVAASEVPIKRVDNIITRFGQTLKNTVKWQISSNIVHGLLGALSGAVGYALDLNKTLTDIRIVTGSSVDDMAKFAVNANKAAKELSTTTKAYADASLIYYQLGDSAELAAKKAATTIKAANVAFTASAKEMSEMLTAVWNSYQVGADQLEHVVDVMANLGAKTASSMEEMATAMQKVAATANTVGVSMEQMSAIVATSASVTRLAPLTVGTAWNTILSRIGGLKLGETLDDGVTLNKYSAALASVGVNILDVTGDLRDMGAVIDELGSKWDTLSRGQKAALAQTIGGARQYTQIMAFFENFGKYQENMGYANNSLGALLSQQETYAQGWEAASKRVKASLESIYGALLNDKAMVAMTSGMATFIQSIENAVKGMGGLKGSIAAIGGILTSVFSKLITANILGTFESLTRVFTNKNNDLDVYKENLLHVKELLLEIKLTSEGAESTETDNAIKLIELRLLLADSQKNMTTELVNAALAIIDSLGNEINYVNQVARAYDEAANAAQKRASTASMSDVFTSLIGEGASRNSVLANDLASYLMSVAGVGFNDAYYNANHIDTLSGFGKDLSTLFTDTTALDVAVSKIDEIAASTGSAEEKTQLYILEIERLKNAFGESSDIGKLLLDVLNNSTTADGFKLGITDVINRLYEMRGIDAGATIEDIIQKIDNAGIMTDELRAYLEGLAESARKAGLQLYAAGASADNLSLNFKNAKGSIENLSTLLSGGLQNLTKMASAAMSFASIMRSTESLASNLAKGTGTIATNIGSMAGSLMSFAMLAKTLIPLIGGPAGIAIGIGAAALGIASGVLNANKEKDEQRRQELISSSSSKVLSLQDEQKSIDDLYLKYLILEEARASSGEVTTEYLNTLDLLLNAIGSESESILALSGDYDQLAESIKNSYKARMESSLNEQKEALNNLLYASLGTLNVLLHGSEDHDLINVLSLFGFKFTNLNGQTELEYVELLAETNVGYRNDLIRDRVANINKQYEIEAEAEAESKNIEIRKHNAEVEAENKAILEESEAARKNNERVYAELDKALDAVYKDFVHVPPDIVESTGEPDLSTVIELRKRVTRTSPTRDLYAIGPWKEDRKEVNLYDHLNTSNYLMALLSVYDTYGSGYGFNPATGMWEEYILEPIYDTVKRTIKTGEEIFLENRQNLLKETASLYTPRLMEDKSDLIRTDIWDEISPNPTVITEEEYNRDNYDAITKSLLESDSFQSDMKAAYWNDNFSGKLSLDSTLDIEAFALSLFDFSNSLDFAKLAPEVLDEFKERFGKFIDLSLIDSIKTVKITEGRLALEEAASTNYTEMMNIVANSLIADTQYDTLPLWAQELAENIVRVYTSGVSSAAQKDIAATQLLFYQNHKYDSYEGFFRRGALPSDDSEFYKAVGFSGGDTLISDIAERTEVVAVKTLMLALALGADWTDIEAKARAAGFSDEQISSWSSENTGGIFGFDASRRAALTDINELVANGEYANKGTGIASSSNLWITFMQGMAAINASIATGREDSFALLSDFADKMVNFSLRGNNRNVFQALEEDAKKFLQDNGLTDGDGNLTDFGKYIVGDFKLDRAFIEREASKFSGLTSATAALPSSAVIDTAHDINWSEDLSKLTKDVSSWTTKEYTTFAKSAFGNFDDYYKFDTMGESLQLKLIKLVLDKAIADTFGENGEKATDTAQLIAYQLAVAVRDAYERGIDAKNFEKKINPIKDAISALGSEINNIVIGKGLSQKSLDILQRVGIDPSKIKDIKSYTQALAELRNKLLTEYLSLLNSYGKEFNPYLSQEQIDAMSEDEQAKYNRLLLLREEINQTNELILSSYATAQLQYTDEVKASIQAMEAEYNKLALTNEKLLTKAETAVASIGKNITEVQALLMGLNNTAEWSSKTIEELTQFATQALNEAYTAQSNLLGQLMHDWLSLVDTVKDSTDAMSELLSKLTNDTKDFATNGKSEFLNVAKNFFNADQIRALSQAWDKASQKLDFSKMSDKQIWEAIKLEAGDALTAIGIDLDKLSAEYKDNIGDIGKTIAELLLADADLTVAIWELAFNTIAGLRKKLFSGENITEDLANDIQSYLLALKSSGLNNEEFLRLVLSGELTGNTLKMPVMTAGLLYDKYGLGMFGTNANSYNNFTNFRANVVKEANANGITELSQILKIERSLLQQLLESSKAYTGYTDNDIKSLLDKYFEYDEEASAQILEAALIMKLAADGQLQLMEANRQLQEQDAAFQNALNSGEMKRISDEQEYKQKDLDLIQKALDKYDKEHHGLDRADFSEDEIARLEKLTGNKFDLITLALLNDASDDAASSLHALAEAAMNAAKSEAEKAGYRQFNGEWHNTLSEGLDEDSYSDLLSDEQLGYELADDGKYYKKGKKATDLDKTLKGYEDAEDKAASQLAEIESENFQKLAKSVGMSTDEFKEYIEALERLGTITGENNKELALNAALLARLTKGFDEARDNLQNYLKLLKKARDGGIENVKVINSMRNMYADLFDLTDKEADTLSEGFITSTKNAKLLQKSLKGDEKAWDELTRSAADDIGTLKLATDQMVTGQEETEVLYSSMEDAMKSIQSWLDNNNLEVGAEIDDAGFRALCEALVSQCASTADEASAMLSALGVNAEIQEHSVTLPASEKVTFQSGTYIPLDETLEPIPVTALVVETEDSKTFKWYTLQGATFNGRGVTGGGSSAPKKGGGGGGKPKEHKQKPPKRVKDEGERYHEIRDKLEQQEHILERIDKIKDRAYGNRHLKALNAEIAAIEKENKLQEQYYAEAAAYLASDKAELKLYGATFNQDGTINYDEYIRKQVSWYNKAIKRSGDDETDKRIEEEYKDRMDALKNYEEALDLVDTIQNEMLENQNKISELLLEAVQYKLEIAVDLNDKDLAKLDYYVNKWSDLLNKQDESMEVAMMKMQDYESNLAAINTAYQELEKGRAQGRLNDSDYQEGLADLQDKTLEYLESIQDLRKEISEYYGLTLDLAEEKQLVYTDKIEHTRNMMESYIEMLQLMGRGQQFTELNNMYETSYRSSLLTALAARDYLDTLYASRETIIRQIELSGWTDTLKQQFDDVEAHIITAEDDLKEKTQLTLEDARNKFENTINAILEATDLAFKSLVDANGNLIMSFDEVALNFEYWNDQQGWYVSTAKELYEVSKINRQIEDSINDATTLTSKERLKALREEINAYAEKNRLTEYDIEMNELQYKMALAMLNLEDAQNAKSTVRLTRDENGNYGYQYTANEDDVDDARQNFEDVLQLINELSYEHLNDLVQLMIESKQNYQDLLLEILTDDTLSLEERNRQAEILTELHLAQMEYLQEQGMRTQEHLLENQGYIQEYYGQTIIENTGLVLDLMHSMMQQMMQDTDGYVEYIKTTLKQLLSDAVNGYAADIGEVGDETGLTWDTMNDSVEFYDATNELAAKDIKTLDMILGDSLSNIATATDKWIAHTAALDNTVSSYEKLLDKMLNVLVALAEIDTVNDRWYNNGAINRPAEMAATAATNRLYNDVNAHNFTENKYEGKLGPLGRAHNTTMNEYDNLTSNLWKYVDNSAIGGLLGLLERDINTNTNLTQDQASGALQQLVNINANFENILNVQDLLDAFNQIATLASQYAYI